MMTREDFFNIPANKKVRNFINEQILIIAKSVDITDNAELNALARAIYEEYKGAGVFKGENSDKLEAVSKKVTFENVENRLPDDLKERLQKFENCITDIASDPDKELLKRINNIGQGVIDKDDNIDDI